ncbi:hypothetical protein [Krasilnikovia sp. M28-CT-15]|uniref:hypothetical protein n=1 Tax=Krasilnikovia sp. M28-CT-15 TaxID=3373540 RepID=UPI00399D4584
MAADDLAAVLDDLVLGTVAAIALGSIGDHRAVPYLVRLALGSENPAWAVAWHRGRYR